MLHIDGKAGKFITFGDGIIKVAELQLTGVIKSIQIPVVCIDNIQIVEPHNRALGLFTICAAGTIHQVSYSKQYASDARKIAKSIKH